MMKELTCALMVIISLVNATPYGYGVKSGAPAKAEAHAGAGAFGGYGQVAPVLPAGGGYSGSYSKSSSSSFASSAASASSSSFSYSGAGSYGVNGAPAIGANGSPAGSGCSSGACANGGTGASPYGGSSIGNIQPFGSGSNAAAGAAAGAFSGSQGFANGAPCIGSNCPNQKPNGCQGPDCDSSKCTTGQCEPKVAPTAPSTFTSNDKCTDGQCGSAVNSETYKDHKCSSGKCSPTSSSALPENENDISVNVAGTKPTLDSNQQSTAYDKKSIDYISPENSPCANKNCGNPTISYLKPSQPNAIPSASTPQGNPIKCDSPNCNTPYDTPAAIPSRPTVPSFNAPSTYFSTPDEGTKCTSPNCDSGNVNPKSEHSPFGYNVPISGFVNAQSEGNNGGCTSGNCDKPASSYKPGAPNKFLSTPYSNNDQSGSFATPCNSPNCASGNPYNQVPKGSYSYPQYQGPTSPTGPSCINGNCAGRPAPNKNSGIGVSSYPASYVNSGIPTAPSYSQGPLYASTGPSGSSGCDGSNCGGSQPAVPSSPASTFPSFVALHDTQPKNAGPTSGVPAQGHIVYSKPITGVAPQKLPAYVGFLKPNENDAPVNVPGLINFDKPKTTVSSNSPVATACTTGNCDTSSGNSPHYGQSFENGAHAVAGAAANANAIAYTGGFGGPPGLLKPFDDGKLGNTELAESSGKHSLGLHVNGGLGNGEHSNNRNSLNSDSSGAYSGSGVQANAVAGSGVGGYNGGFHHQPGHHGNGAGGCNNGCGGNGSEGSYGGHSNFGLSGGYGLSKHGLLGSGLAGSASKSISGALSGGGSGSFGLGGSFASSGAFSHAGAAKGGYGR